MAANKVALVEAPSLQRDWLSSSPPPAVREVYVLRINHKRHHKRYLMSLSDSGVAPTPLLRHARVFHDLERAYRVARTLNARVCRAVMSGNEIRLALWHTETFL